MIHRLLFEGKINVNRRAYLWNMVSSLAFSMQSALFLWIATKVSGVTEAGSFIILFTVAQTLYSLGNYNIRDFQVSDVRGEYSFSTYYSARWFTCLLMLLAAGGYCAFKHLSGTRGLVLMCLVGYRFIESFEDVNHGLIQRKGRFDVTTICASIRILIASLAFCIGYLVSGSPLVASLTLLMVSLAVYCCLMHLLRTKYADLKPAISLSAVSRLLTACFPVFIGAFLYTYLVNAPKYAIDNCLAQDAQTVYSILFMPIFVINTFSMFVYKPQLVQMSELWNHRDIPAFRRRMIRQTLIVICFTAAAMIGGGLIGLKLLELIYGVPLMAYVDMFVILLGFGGVAAIAYYFNALIIIIRRQQFILVGYVSALIMSLLFTNRLVIHYQIRGAGYAYGLIMVSLMLFYLLVIVVNLSRTKKES